MADLILPTYKGIISNEVYQRNAEPLADLENIPVLELFRITRYTTPTKQSIIDYIKKHAGCISGAIIAPNMKDDLLEALKMLPEDELRDIANENDDAIKHLENHCTQTRVKENARYVEIASGILPSGFLDDIKKLAREHGNEIYQRAIERTAKQKWGMRIKLQENGSFPDSLELEYLIARGVRDSDVFAIKGEYNYKQATNNIRILSSALNSTELITSLTDRTDDLLETRSTDTVIEVVKCLKMKEVVQGLGGIISGIIKDARETKEKKDYKCPPHSMN